MSTMSFKKGAAKDASTAVAEPEQEAPTAHLDPAVSEGGDKTVAVRADSTVSTDVAKPSEDMGGEWNRDDVRLPRVNLVHKTSAMPLISAFGIGSFVLNKEVKIGDGTKPTPVFVLRAVKDYVQKLPFGDPEQPAVFKTEAEVLANGGSLKYQDYDNGNFFQPRAHIQLVTALPAGASDADEALFPYEFDGVSYAMAMLTVASSAYTSVGKEIATLRNNNKVMRKGLWFGRLDLTSEVRTNAKNSWHIPVVKYAGENEAKLAEFLHSLL